MKNIDWSNLPFGYMRTDYNVRCYYRNGEWGALELCSEETINLHMAATCLHYGQEGFEGLKAYRGKDGKIRIFRPEANAERLQSTCRGILMPELPTELFVNAVKKGLFHVYAVSTIDEGIEVLTGVPAGKKDKNGNFPAGTINYLAYEKLKKYAKNAEKI